MEKLNKRKRSDNWLEVDKTLLKELVKDRVSIIENKNTDTNSNQKKKKAWQELEESFNNLCQGAKRNIFQLKSQWTLIKIQAKKIHAFHRKEVMATGGGPKPSDIAMDATDISVWLPQEFIIDNNKFDTDAAVVYEQNISEVEIIDSQELFEVLPTNTTEEAKFEKTTATQFDDYLDVEKPLKKKRTLPLLSQNVANSNIEKLTESEIKIREELHIMQMENEKKRGRNLDIEYKLIQENEKRKARNLDLEFQILQNKIIHLSDNI